MTLIEQTGDGLLDNLPLLTQVADEDEPDELPTLTEIVEETQPAAHLPPLGAADMQQSLKRLEAHLETVFTQKLSLNLAQLQRQAIEQAVSELKAELPDLLRNALNTHHGL
jgi:hypothetical protein